ncbi:MAG: M6 family metalloprotease domain-containing protein [Muribaculaceae bacterium]|nr:M6 family metalloprotease domain-containing protein [Muribaculaceae bacterium]
MKRFLPSLAVFSLSAAMAVPAAAEVAMPSVREGDFYCFQGMPQNQINYLPAIQKPNRPIFRIDKLGNSKFDNTDGHDLREIPTSGDFPVLVILVEFTDSKFTRSWGDPHEIVTQMLNSPEYTFQNATGSVNNYFQRVSGGQFNPQFDVAGPVQISKKEVEYVTSNPDDFYVDPASGKNVTVYPAGRMVEEAVKALEDQIDFTKYDTDNDGYVDFVYLFFAGQGATTGGDRYHHIWPHAFTLNAAIGGPVEVDGVKVNRYCTSSELGVDRKLSGIGTFCHEFSHVLGLPDYYDTANNNGTVSKCFSPGSYSNMDAGNYNNSEHTPPFFSSYEQYAMEWMKPASLSGTGRYTLLPLEARPFAYQLVSQKNPQEYYLLEARGKSFLDQHLKGHGLLAWHIDFDLGIWTANTVNNNSTHQRIDLIEADNMFDESTRNGDPFPGVSGICEFTKSVSPSFKDWSGTPMGYDLREISSNFDGTVSFVATGDKQIDSSAELAAPSAKVISAGPDSFELVWTPVDNAKEYYVSVFDANKFNGTQLSFGDYMPGWYFKNVGNVNVEDGLCSLTVEGLPANAKCGVMVYAANDLNASRMTSPVFVSTVDGNNFAAASTNLRIGAGEEYAIAEWDAVEGADGYELLFVDRKKNAATESMDHDFESLSAPKGWTVAGNKYDNRKYGLAAPSLSFQQPGSSLESPVYEQPVSKVSFWATKRYSDNLCELDVYALDKNGNSTLAYSLDNIPLSGVSYDEALFNLEMPAETYGVRFVYNFRSTDLFCYFDDLKVEFNDGYVDTPVDDVEIEYGQEFAKVRGLEDGRDYIAYLYPLKANERGAKSNELFFRPENLTPSGVESLPAESIGNVSFRVDGMQVIVSDPNMAYDVFSADGSVIAQGIKGNLTLPARGIYILRATSKSVKVIL